MCNATGRNSHKFYHKFFQESIQFQTFTTSGPTNFLPAKDEHRFTTHAFSRKVVACLRPQEQMGPAWDWQCCPGRKGVWWSGPTKIWKFHPVFLQEKTCQTRPDWIDPSDRLFWDLSLCCLNMVYHRYPNFQPQKLGLHQQAWDCVVRCPKKFGSIRGPGTPRGRRARPGGRKDQIDFLWNLFSKKYRSWRLKCLCLMLFAISITWTSKTSWLSTKIGDVLWKSLASKKPKPRCVAA